MQHVVVVVCGSGKGCSCWLGKKRMLFKQNKIPPRLHSTRVLNKLTSAGQVLLQDGEAFEDGRRGEV